MNAEALAGWLPIRAYWRENRPWLDWCYLGTERFREPFFEQTLGVVVRQPFQAVFRHQTSIEFLGEFASRVACPEPTGFIFHMSRCGSTLITQMLAALPCNLVLSEPGPIDWLLRSRLQKESIPAEERMVWFQGLVRALGQKRTPELRHYFIKFHSWHVVELAFIRRAFPNVPWIFVERDPVEVMVSHQRQRGAQMLPGAIDPRFLGLENTEWPTLSRDEFCARALGKICQAVVDQPGVVPDELVHYEELPEAVIARILPWFHVSFAEPELDTMRSAAQFHAKNPKVHFVADRESKQAEATSDLRRWADQWATPAYRRLEDLRTRRGH